MVNTSVSVAYDSIRIDNKEVMQSLLNIDDKRRSNLFAWRGQFSPQFIEAILDNYATEHTIVADPFLGSGTVLYECARRNITAVGIELNPSAYYMAKTYELCELNGNQRTTLFHTVENQISCVLCARSKLDKMLEIISNNPYSIVRNVLSLITVLMDLYNNDFSSDLLHEKWADLKCIISAIPYSSGKVRAILGDARKMGIKSNAIDLIITSPPYINVFNYHQKYRRSIEVLGYDALKIARGEVGANRKNRGNRFLTVVEYCLDMALAIEEMKRISKPNARIILVVGKESNVLSNAFCNSELIYKLASGIHGLPLVLKQQRVFKNKYGQMIYEDILHFSNTISDNIYNQTTLLDAARQVGISALLEKQDILDESDKNYRLLMSAINGAKSVKPSEGL